MPKKRNTPKLSGKTKQNPEFKHRDRERETEKCTLALGIARVSSRTRSLIPWTWNSTAFKAASMADKSVTLLAGYTKERQNGTKLWTKKAMSKRKSETAKGFKVFHTVSSDYKLLKLSDSSVEGWDQRIQRIPSFLRIHGFVAQEF